MSTRAVAAGWVLSILAGLLVVNLAYSRDRDCQTSTVVNRGVDQVVGRDTGHEVEDLDQLIADCLDDEASAEDLQRALTVVLSVASASALVVFLLLWKGPRARRRPSRTRAGGRAPPGGTA